MFMEKVILIKYGELSTKKDNINFFLKKLRENICPKRFRGKSRL